MFINLSKSSQRCNFCFPEKGFSQNDWNWVAPHPAVCSEATSLDKIMILLDSHNGLGLRWSHILWSYSLLCRQMFSYLSSVRLNYHSLEVSLLTILFTFYLYFFTYYSGTYSCLSLAKFFIPQWFIRGLGGED